MKHTSKRISTSFTVIIVLVVILTGALLFRIFTHTKPKPVAVAAVVAVAPHKKHKKKHKHQKYVAANSSVINMDTVKAAPPKPVVVAVVTAKPIAVPPPPVKPVVVVPVAIAKTSPPKLFQDTVKTARPNSSYLYATYIHANVTGIVKMRANDQYNATAVADIPGNSKVLVLAKGASFYKVSYNNNIGFIPKWTLQDK